jgi:RHS repeat-associated protein
LRFDHVTTASDQDSAVGYRWDGNDRLHMIVDGATHATTQVFDGLDRLYQTTTGIGTSTFEYLSGSRRLRQSTDAAGTVSTYIDNEAGRPTSIDTVDGPGLSKPGFKTSRIFAYTHLGDLESATIQDSEHTSTVRLKFDSLRRKVSETNDAIPFWLTRTYTPRIPSVPAHTDTEIVVGTGAVTTIRSTDELGRIASVSLHGESLAQYQYARGALDQIKFNSGVIQSMSYDDHARLVGVALRRDDSQLAVLTEGLGDDDVPRMRRQQVASLAATTDLFKTDLAGRVTDENLRVPGLTVPAGNVTNDTVAPLWTPTQPTSSFALDGAANWSSKTGSGALAPVIDNANRYTALGSASVKYDGAGATTAVSEESYSWDGLGRLRTASMGGSATQSQFRYDALGRRMVELKDGQASYLLWDGGNIAGLGSLEPRGTQLRIFDDKNQTIALASQAGRGPLTYVHAAPDRSTFAVTDSSGALAEAYSYSAFGDVTALDPNGGAARKQPQVRFLFQGQYRESFAPNYLMGAREYRPAWGRFLSPDPIGWLGGPNLYAFVSGRPLTLWDPLGFSSADSRPWGPANPEYVREERKLWAQATRAGFDRFTTNNLIRFYDSPGVPYIDDVLNLASVRATAAVENWTRGNYLDAVAHGELATLEGLAAPLFGRSDSETATRVGGALLFGAGLNKLTSWSYSTRPTWTPLVTEDIPGTGELVSEPSLGRGLGCPGCPCFPTGTLVVMSDGSAKPIEEVQAGDSVLAKEPGDDQPAAPHQVRSTTTNRTHRLVLVTARATNGETGTIAATGEHPLWTRRDGWIAAAELRSGDELLDHAGSVVLVTNVAEVSRDSTTHNLSVEGAHTFFVVANDVSVLVHNVDPWDILFSHQLQGERNLTFGTEETSNPIWRGRTLQEAADQARALGRLPDGLRIEAQEVNGQLVSVNNRTLWVAQQANLPDVEYTDLGGKTFHKLQTNFRENGLGRPLAPDEVGGPILCP